jgi:hypothetical protein
MYISFVALWEECFVKEGVVALFERSADELFIVRHTADFLLVFT